MMTNDDLGHRSPFGCHVVESDDMAPGSVVNNKVRDGNEDLLRIKMMNDNYVVVCHFPRHCQ